MNDSGYFSKTLLHLVPSLAWDSEGQVRKSRSRRYTGPTRRVPIEIGLRGVSIPGSHVGFPSGPQHQARSFAETYGITCFRERNAESAGARSGKSFASTNHKGVSSHSVRQGCAL